MDKEEERYVFSHGIIFPPSAHAHQDEPLKPPNNEIANPHGLLRVRATTPTRI